MNVIQLVISSLIMTFATAAATANAHEAAAGASADAIDTNAIPWTYVAIPELDHQLPLKPLFEDPQSGMSVIKIRYQAGFTNTWHTHTTGHGMYVLDGYLRTHKGTFGPGEFVWFPEGERMFHGATEHNDTEFIFITNKAMDIHYEQRPTEGED